MEERRIDQHECWKAESDRGPDRRCLRSNNSKNYDNRVRYVEIAPPRWKAQNITCPVLPIKNVFFQYVQTVSTHAEPQH